MLNENEVELLKKQVKEMSEKIEKIRIALGVPQGGPLIETVAKEMRERATAFDLLKEVTDKNVGCIVAANRIRKEVEAYRKIMGINEINL